MLISKTKNKKRLKVVSNSEAKAPENASNTPSTPFDSPPEESKQEAAIPKRGKPGRPVKKSFWDHVNEISPEEWEGKRFYIYAYLSEPYGNVKTSGEPGYLRKFYEAIDPETLLLEWGSGKYFLRLKEKRPGEKSDRDVDTLSIEIANPSYPPKLPRKLWESDPRNEKWLAMLPKEQKEQSKAETIEILNAMFDMQDRIEERIEERSGGRDDSPNSVLDAAVRLIELTKPKEAALTAPAIDPWAAADRILNMRSDNPMVTILSKELSDLRTELAAERLERSQMQERVWEAKLAALEAKMQPNSAPKSFVDQMKEFGEAKTQLLSVLGIGGDGATAAPAARSRMNPTLEFIRDIVPEVINSPIMGAAAQWLMNLNAGGPRPGQPGMQINPASNPGMPPPQNGQPSQQNTLNDLIRFVQETLVGPLLEHLDRKDSGGDFAEMVHSWWRPRLWPLQHMQHPQLPGQEGAPVIIELFKHADVWQSEIAHREAQFRQFVAEFCAWRPETAEAEQPADNAVSVAGGSGETDLDAEEDPK